MEIPRLDRRTVLPTAGPQARLNVEAPAMGTESLGEGVERAAAGLAVVESRERARDARSELAALEAKMIDAETGLIVAGRQKLGRDAFGLADSSAADFDKVTTELAGTITEGRVKAAFEEMRLSRRSSLMRGMALHEAEQKNVYQDGIAKAQLESLANLAATDPSQAGYAKDRSRWTLEDMGARKGMPREAIDQAVLDAESAVESGVVRGMLANGRYSEAAKYFADNRAAFTAKDAAALDPAVREGRVRQESQDLADGIVARGVGLSGALEAAAAIEDADVRKATRELVRQHYSDREAALQIAERQAADTAWDIYEKTGDWRKIPPDVWMATPGPTRESIKGQQSSGGRRGTDWGMYYEIRQAALDDPQTFAGMDLRNMLPALGDTEFKELTKLQEDIRTGKSDSDLLGGIQTEQQIVDSTMRGIGLKWGDSARSGQNKKAAEFRRQVTQSIRALEAATGKRADKDQVQKIADNLAIEVTVPKSGILWDDKKRVYEVTPEDIAPEVRSEIEDALRAEGRPVTDETVWALFLAGRMQEADGGR